MGLNIGPILPRNPVSGVKRAASSRSDATADKVKRIKLPTGYQRRNVAVLKEATDLSRYIKTKWDELDPEELAENIIDLEDKIAVLKETSPAIDKVRRLAQHLHFKFVFPLAGEMEKAPPVSFARMIYKAASEVFKTHSLQPFNELNGMQQREVMRYASGRVS